MAPRETEDNAYAKFWGDKQRALWYVIRPFPRSKNSGLQNEAKCKTFLVKMSFICMKINNHINGFALSLVAKQRLVATRKWPIISGIYAQRCLVFFLIKENFIRSTFWTFW